MKLDQNSVYRSVITPWYDSNAACRGMLVFLGLVILFAGVGIWVALTNSDYEAYVWFPVTLASLAAFVMVKTGFRLVHRNREDSPFF
ncbi:hypothetical protein [Desulforapulum autotrophicum]|uniref:hypothetical protein n=1 Tax=Desulforapulum autotrophicum TaxID=2296 RepID=UPI0011D13BD8|nr:hypothetical protein [Desulforapulum autotrophicum]